MNEVYELPRGVKWSGVKWRSVKWRGVKWSGVKWSGVKWSGVKWVESSVKHWENWHHFQSGHWSLGFFSGNYRFSTSSLDITTIKLVVSNDHPPTIDSYTYNHPHNSPINRSSYPWNQSHNKEVKENGCTPFLQVTSECLGRQGESSEAGTAITYNHHHLPPPPLPSTYLTSPPRPASEGDIIKVVPLTIRSRSRPSTLWLSSPDPTLHPYPSFPTSRITPRKNLTSRGEEVKSG